MEVYRFKCKCCGATRYKKPSKNIYECLYCHEQVEVYKKEEEKPAAQVLTEEQVEAKVKEIISKEKAPAKSKAKPAEYNAKNLILFLVCCFGGWFGIHRFIQGKIITGLIFALSGGVFGVGVFLDCLVLGIDAIKDAKKYMKEKEKTNG